MKKLKPMPGNLLISYGAEQKVTEIGGIVLPTAKAENRRYAVVLDANGHGLIEEGSRVVIEDGSGRPVDGDGDKYVVPFESVMAILQI